MARNTPNARPVKSYAGQAMALGSLYLATYWIFDGAMLRAPDLLVLSLALSLIWLSIEDIGHLSFSVGGLCLFSAICLVLLFSLDGDVRMHLLAAMFYGLFFVALDWLFQRRMGRTALGLGDSVLIAGAGLLLGLSGPIQVILVASVGALVWIGGRELLIKGSLRTALPFGPFLAFGIWLTLLEPSLI
ncbi:MAG: hypothetical protein AAFQ66_05550 [Pseudomonadota bacterium]